MKQLIRGANAVINDKIRYVIDKFKASEYIQKADPIRYRTTRKELELGGKKYPKNLQLMYMSHTLNGGTYTYYNN